MTKIKLKNLDQVWMAMDDGKTVYWASDAYKLIVVPSDLSWREHNGFEIPFSNRCGYSLDSDTRMAFPYVVWGPYMNFAQGAVFGLFIDYDDALLCAHAMNRELEKAKRG